MRLPRLTLSLNGFRLVYWIIALATAQHTAWGAATTMQGRQPSGNPEAAFWWLQGAAFAIAIDFTMVQVATKIRSGMSTGQSLRLHRLTVSINWYVITFIAVAMASTYFQFLYAWYHADSLPNGAGVVELWRTRMQGMVDSRIVIAPFILPIIAMLYTFGGFGKGGEAQPKRNVASNPPSQRVQSDAIRVERVDVTLPELPPSPPRNILPEPQKIRNDDGHLTAYICPGCHKELSVSGWSRHKAKCPEYLEIMSNS